MKIPYMPDEYAWRARAVPVIIGVAPALIAVILLATTWHPILKGTALALGISAATWLCCLTGGLPGKRIERHLWEKQGGRPTTRFLQRNNLEYNRFTRCRIHKKLQELGLDMPTEDEEANNPHSAVSKWESCVDEIIRRTRNKNLFPLVFQNLADYGMHRNMVGLKYFGITISAFAMVAGVWLIFDSIRTGSNPVEPAAVAIASLAFLIVWVAVATQKNLKTSDERYARSLLEAVLQLE